MMITFILLFFLSFGSLNAMHHLSNEEFEKCITERINDGSEDTWQLLRDVNKYHPNNYALKAYVIGKTWRSISSEKDYYSKCCDAFNTIFKQAHEKGDQKGKEVYEIMYSRFQNNGDPVDAAARSNRVRGLSFFQGKEPFTAIHLFLAVLEKRKEAFEFLFNAGCPVQNSMRPMKEQPLVQALKDQQEEFVKKLMARVDLTIPYQYDYPKEATIKEYFEKEYIDDAESKACYYRGMGYINSVSKPNYSAQRTLLKKYESWYAS